MLQELLETQRRAWADNTPLRVEQLLETYPSLRETPDELRELVFQEIILEARSGSSPDIDEYVSRFPDMADDVRQMFEIHNEQPTATTADYSFADARALHGNTARTSTVQVLGDYEIIHEIARGGMGVVYKARQVSAGRTVALKMIRAGELAGDNDIDRFRLEAVAAANLDHPGIVPVFDVGLSDGQHYFSMGYIDGPSLAQHLAAGPMQPKPAAELVRSIAEAISYAHHQGVIHRDLKPGNVLLDGGDKPRVTDFGLAKRMDEDTGLTVSGQIMGTPSYMAPEQAAGRNSQVGPASDQYSLGAILYHAVTGRPPFQASSVLQTIELVTNKDPVPPHQLNPSVDRDLNTIILKTLGKSPAERYPTTDAFIDDLTRYLNHLPIQARPVSFLGRAVRWKRRNPLVATLLTVLTVGLLAVAIGAFVVAVAFEDNAATEKSLREESVALAKENQAATTREELARAAEAAAIDEAKSADILAGRIQYAAETLKGSAVFEKPQLARSHVARHLEYWHPGAWEVRGRPELEPHIFAGFDAPPDFRGWEFFMLSAVTNTDTERTTGFDLTTKFTGATAATGDGRIAFATLSGIHVATALDFRSARFTPVDQIKIYRLDFHPDGRRIASAGKDGTIRIWEVDSKVRAQQHRLEHGAPVNFVSFLGIGEKVVSHGKDGVAHVWDLATHAPQTTIDGLPEHCALTVSPDGALLAVAVKIDPQTSVVKCFDTTTGDLVSTFERDGHTDTIQWIDFSPDGSRLATAGSDSTVLVWDVPTRAVTLRMTQHSLRVLRVAWHPQSNLIASAGEDHVVRVWDATTGEHHRHFTRHTAEIYGLIWSGTGEYLYSASKDTDFEINDLTSPQPVARYQIPGARRGATPVALHWNTDSDQVSATLGSGHTLVTLSEQSSTPTPQSHHQCWSPDGTHHAYLDGDRLMVSAAGKPLSEYRVDPQTFAHLEWSPSPPARLAFLDGEQVKIWQVSRPTPEVFYTAEDIDCLGWKPDGSQLAVSSRADEVQILEAHTGESLANFHCSPPNKGLSEAYAVRWNPGGDTFATAILSNDAVLFDSETWKVTSKLDHALAVKDLAWSPPGQPPRLATAGNDNQVQIWDPENSILLMSLPHPYPVQRVSWSPDGKKIASMDNSGLVKIWDASHGYVARGNVDDEISAGRR